MITTIWHSGKGRSIGIVKKDCYLVFAGFGEKEGGMNWWNAEELQGSETCFIV
jgi:hypothetical protein